MVRDYLRLFRTNPRLREIAQANQPDAWKVRLSRKNVANELKESSRHTFVAPSQAMLRAAKWRTLRQQLNAIIEVASPLQTLLK